MRATREMFFLPTDNMSQTKIRFGDCKSALESLLQIPAPGGGTEVCANS